MTNSDDSVVPRHCEVLVYGLSSQTTSFSLVAKLVLFPKVIIIWDSLNLSVLSAWEVPCTT